MSGISQFGRKAIAVDQATGCGQEYPFVGPSGLEQLIADLYLIYRDTAGTFTLPFFVTQLWGFGTHTVTPPSPPTHTYDIVIEDADSHVVFDSRTADAPQVHNWGTHLRIIQWVHGDNVLRVVQHTAWHPDDTPVVFDTYIAPASAVIDSTVVTKIPANVQSIRSVGGSKLKGTIRLVSGFNCDLTGTADGVLFEAAAGLGDGQYGDICDASNPKAIRTIGGQGPNEHGDFKLDADACFRIERPVLSTGGTTIRTANVAPAKLQLFGDCEPCCDCTDLVKTYEGIRGLRNKIADKLARLHAVRDKYACMVDRFNEQAALRSQDVFRVQVLRRSVDRLGFSIGYANTGYYGEPLHNIVLPFSFEYLDTTGITDGSAVMPEPLKADTTYSGTPVLDKATVFRSGNFRREGGRTGTVQPIHPYAIGGSWPHFYICFESIALGTTGAVLFDISFPDGEAGDAIEFVLDAFATEDEEDAGGGIPVAGYTPGSGATGAAAVAARICPRPEKFLAGVLGDGI